MTPFLKHLECYNCQPRGKACARQRHVTEGYMIVYTTKLHLAPPGTFNVSLKTYCAILKLDANFETVCNAISKLRKFPKCAEHIYTMDFRHYTYYMY